VTSLPSVDSGGRVLPPFVRAWPGSMPAWPCSAGTAAAALRPGPKRRTSSG